MITAYTDWTTAHVKKVRYYLRDFSIDYGHLVYTLYPFRHWYNVETIVSDINSAFLVSVDTQLIPGTGVRVECKFESPSEFLEFSRHIHVEYVGRVFSDFENPRKYIEFEVPKTNEYKDFIVESFDYEVNHLTHDGEIVICVSDSIDELVSYILHFYPTAQFRYEMSCSEPTKIRVELGEAGVFDFANNRVTSIGTEKGNHIRIRFDDYKADTSLARRYLDTDIAVTKKILNDSYGIANAKIKDYFPGYTYTPRRESQPKYFAVSSEGYKPIERIDVVDEWLDTGDMWNMCIKRYTNEPLSAGVAIIKEEDNMAGYHYDSINRQNYKTIKETRKDTDIIPKIIRNVQFNEKKGVVTVIWLDGTVTMAKCGPNDIWDPEKGLSIAIMKYFFKSTTSMNKWIKKTVPEEEPVEPAKSDDPKESFF